MSTSARCIPVRHPSLLHTLSAFHKRRTRFALLPRTRRCQPSSHWTVPQAHLTPWIVSLSTVGLLSLNKAGRTWPREERCNQPKDKNKLAATSSQGTAPRGTSPTWGQAEARCQVSVTAREKFAQVYRRITQNWKGDSLLKQFIMMN